MRLSFKNWALICFASSRIYLLFFLCTNISIHCYCTKSWFPGSDLNLTSSKVQRCQIQRGIGRFACIKSCIVSDEITQTRRQSTF